MTNDEITHTLGELRCSVRTVDGMAILCNDWSAAVDLALALAKTSSNHGPYEVVTRQSVLEVPRDR